MGAIGVWLRMDLRRRARSLLVLALLVGLSSGTVLAAFAGARRGDSALTRLRHRTLPANSVVLANTPGFDWTRVAKLPEVAALTGFVVDYSMGAEGLPASVLGFPPADDATMRTVEKPVVYDGRVFDPKRADEVVVTRKFVQHFHRGVGDHIVLLLPSEADVEAGNEGVYKGPKVTTTIVGVVNSPWFSDQPGDPGHVVVSPGLAARYPANVIGDQHDKDNTAFINVLVRLRSDNDVAQFRRDVARVTGRDDLDVWDLPAQEQQRQHNITFEAMCLVAFGLTALAAALFLAGQAVSRYTTAGLADLRSLQALGVTPGEATIAAAGGPLAAGVLGAALGVVGAYVASSRFPLGTAGLLEPSPGHHFDTLVLLPGAVVTVVLVAAGAAMSARRALARSDVPARAGSTIAGVMASGSMPVSVVIGTRFALEPGRGRSAVPVRPAIVGAIVGLLGITAAFTFSYAVRDAASDPTRFGQTFHLIAFTGISNQAFGDADRLVEDLDAQPTVTGADHARSAVVGNVSGSASISVFTYAAGPKPLPTVLTSGRMPIAPNEITLAPVSMAALHAHVGDRVTLVGSAGKADFDVVGEGFVPAGPHNSYSDGAWISDAGYDRVVTGFKFDLVFVSLASSHHVDSQATALVASIVARDPSMKGLELDPPDPIGAIAELRQVETLPLALGVFLVILALGAVGHAIASAVRRRSEDLAVLRAIGMTPWQCRTIVITQSSVLAVLGLVFGLPLGVAAGRVVWHVVADYTPLQYVPPLAGLELILAVPAALVLANALGALPGHRAARLQVTHVLRTE